MFLLGRPSLLRRHVLFIFLALVATLGSLGFWSMQALQSSTQEILSERLELAETVALHIDMHLSDVAARLATVASSEEVASFATDPMPARGVLRGAYQAHTDVFTHGLYLFDSSGVLVWAEPPEHARSIGKSFASESFIRTALASARPTFSGHTAIPDLPEPGVLVAIPIRSPGNPSPGLVVAGLDPARPNIAGLIDVVHVGRTGYAQVVDDTGTVVTSAVPEALSQDTDHGPRFVQLINNRQTMVGTCHRCHETERGPERRRDVLAFAPLSVAPWGVAVRQSEDEAFALVNDLQRRVIALGFISTLVLTYMGWSIARGIVTPIQRLTLAAREIASGEFAGHIPRVGTDEVGTLAVSLEAMRLKLNSSREEAEKRNAELQRKSSELEALFDASRALTSTLDVQAIVSAIVHKTGELVSPADGSALFLWDDQTQRLVPRASLGFDSQLFSRMRIASGEAIVGKVFRSGTSLLLKDDEVLQTREDMTPENREFFDRSGPGQEPAQQVICVPLIAKGVTTGALIVYNFGSPGRFTDADVRVLQALADEAAIAVENGRLYEEIHQKEEQRRHLLDKVILAQEEERKRVARDLHDEIGQRLTALAMGLGGAEDALPSEQAELRGRLAGIRELSEDTLREIRRLMVDLRPTLLDDLGLIPAVKWYAESHLDPRHVQLDFEAIGLKRRLPPQMETVLFRTLQEAINNIAKHAAATTVGIRLEMVDSTVNASVEDNGRGFDVAIDRYGGETGLGLGLLGMQERVNLLGGAFRVESRPGEGTCLAVSIPLLEAREEL